ncbi:hypothetical protein HAX54_026981 [Datura stramonium]|uniref:Uncharacterized protein n=1 Tax=Datura stramonium TaxID=4076 RepID=A0ABS8S8C2_DATST|nr:hypothetical protein [Datura stramonium]
MEMSVSDNQAEVPVVYVRKRLRRATRIEELVANVVVSPARKDKEIGQKSSKSSRREPKELLENNEAKTIKIGRTKNCSNSSSKLNTTRQCEDGGAGTGNAKIISGNKDEKRKTWKPQTQEETNWNQLAPVHGGNIDYVSSQLEFAKDLGEAAQKFAHTKVCCLKKSLQIPLLNNNFRSTSTYNAKRKGKEVQQERNNTMDFANVYAQRGNKGITICAKRPLCSSPSLDPAHGRSSVHRAALSICGKSGNPGSEEMAKLLVARICHSSGQKLQLQNPTSLNQVSPNNFFSNSKNNMNVWARHHKPRAIVHPTKIISPSRFSQNYDQNMQRTSVSAPCNFSFMKLLMEDEDSSTLTDEELLYGKQLLNTQGLSSEGQKVQQPPCSQVGNYQFENSLQQINLPSYQYQVLQQPQEISYMDLLTREFEQPQEISYMDQLTREFEQSQEISYVDLLTREFDQLQEISYMDLLTREFEPPQEISFMNLLTREFQQPQEISHMDLPTRELQQPLQISYRDLLTRELLPPEISFMDLLTREDISWI